MKRVAALLKEDIASASLHQIWRASTNLAGLWSEMNEGRKSTPKENLKPKCSLAGFSEKLTTFNFQGAVLFIQWVPPQVHHTGSCGCDSRKEISVIHAISWSMTELEKLSPKEDSTGSQGA